MYTYKAVCHIKLQSTPVMYLVNIQLRNASILFNEHSAH